MHIDNFSQLVTWFTRLWPGMSDILSAIMGEYMTKQLAAKRLILGFDAGCMTCSRIAEDAAAASGGKLEVMNLSSPEMVQWRTQALGATPPWKPTLVELAGTVTSVRTGPAIGLALIRNLGTVGSWAVLQAIGKLRQKSGEATRGPELGPSRSAFLRGLTGAALGVSILAGSSNSAMAAGNAKKMRNNHWFDEVESVAIEELSPDRAMAAWRKAVTTDNFAKLAALPSMSAGLTLAAAENVRGVTCKNELDNGPTVRGAVHALKDGGTMTALALIDEDRITVTYEVATKSGTIRRLTKVHQVTGELTSRLVAEADDGVATDISALRAASDAGLTPMADGCPDCMSRRCDDMDWGCAAACCGACRFANFFAMMGCLAVFCPGCTVGTCCRRYSCQPIARCGPY
ncbi:hypothetical protein [Arthrobacter sp. ISL-69]|uniref:hypothetical protein n=1 Tax=Arthrobacter sp. ISL-69 TaxID=2819113 RepID=UPI001BE7DBCD|nr:hypothetical protein [Arthrobacter sp. ISL-69]MBT2535094.1 hypothetical protein [Arthrobacter sp. ISL-69]